MIHWLRHMVLLLALTGLFSSCSQVEDARLVVAEADSLRTAGIAYDDSLSIAEAAATLSHVRNIYPTDYARANYYYGRLLRTRGDQPAAILAFLNVVHSRSKDFAVKARSYSNIGTMCNYAGEFAMAYDMYGQSAECFGEANETRLYYYAQNAKALQLAELSLHDETLLLLDSITSTCDDSGVLVKTWETKAFLYVNTQQYDSALHAIHMLHAAGYHDPCGYVKQAQAFLPLRRQVDRHAHVGRKRDPAVRAGLLGHVLAQANRRHPLLQRNRHPDLQIPSQRQARQQRPRPPHLPRRHPHSRLPSR